MTDLTHIEQIITRALLEGLRRAASKATSFLVGDPANGVPLRSPMAHEVAAAILSLLTKEEGR